MLQRISLLFVLTVISLSLFGQENLPEISYTAKPRKYVVAAIDSCRGNNDPRILANLSGLCVGQEVTIPGDDITAAIKKYWDYGLFSDVKIYAKKIEGRDVYLEIFLQERPRLSMLNYHGLKKAEIEAVDEKVAMIKGSQVTPSSEELRSSSRTILVDKGFTILRLTLFNDDTSESTM